MISIDKFAEVIENTPLISIDFLIENSEGSYLLGKRLNPPAKGYWFTLGGRIFKNETIADAIQRLSLKEFNRSITMDAVKFHGIYEHFYPDSIVSETVSTHYVVLAYRLRLDCDDRLPVAEHDEYRYFSVNELMSSDDVHPYVKDYFKGSV